MNKRIFYCQHCEFKANLNFIMKKHYLKAHSELVTCSVCNDKFKNKNYLKTYISTIHEGKKPYPCTICSYVATQKAIEGHF